MSGGCQTTDVCVKGADAAATAAAKNIRTFNFTVTAIEPDYRSHCTDPATKQAKGGTLIAVKISYQVLPNYKTADGLISLTPAVWSVRTVDRHRLPGPVDDLIEGMPEDRPAAEPPAEGGGQGLRLGGARVAGALRRTAADGAERRRRLGVDHPGELIHPAAAGSMRRSSWAA